MHLEFSGIASKILVVKPFHSFPSQVDVVLACCMRYNYILGVAPHEKFLNDDVQLEEESEFFL